MKLLDKLINYAPILVVFIIFFGSMFSLFPLIYIMHFFGIGKIWMIFMIVIVFAVSSWLQFFVLQYNAPDTLLSEVQMSFAKVSNQEERDAVVCTMAPKFREKLLNDHYLEQYGGNALSPLFKEIFKHKDLTIAIFSDMTMAQRMHDHIKNIPSPPSGA